MNINYYWNKFVISGSIFDYLDYANVKKNKNMTNM